MEDLNELFKGIKPIRLYADEQGVLQLIPEGHDHTHNIEYEHSHTETDWTLGGLFETREELDRALEHARSLAGSWC